MTVNGTEVAIPSLQDVVVYDRVVPQTGEEPTACIVGDRLHIVDIDCANILNKIKELEAMIAALRLEIDISINTNIGDSYSEIINVVNTADYSLAERILTLEAKLNDALARLEETMRVYADANQATATYLLNLESQYSANQAAITVQYETIANANSALATAQTTLTSTVSGQSATLSSLQQTSAKLVDGIAQLRAEASVLSLVNGRINGWKMLNDGSVASFDIYADKFNLFDGTGTYRPFSISNGVVTFTGAATDAIARNSATTAAQAAANAQTAANAANTAITEIASDNILSPVEKPQIIKEYTVITTEQNGIDTEANRYSITTEKTNYDNAVAALTSYLNGLTSPTAWNNTSGNTTIVGSIFRAKFADVYTKRQALLNKIAAVAKGAIDSKTSLTDVQAWMDTTNYVLANEVADAINNNTTKINGSKIVTGTIYADTIAANAIAVANSYYVAGYITAVASFGSSLTTANTNSIGSFTVTNSSTTTPQKMLLSVAGRTGFTGTDGYATYQAFGIFVGGTKLFDYGWSPSGQDSKAGCCTFVVYANSSVTVDIRAAKTNAADTLTMVVTCSTLGVRN